MAYPKIEKLKKGILLLYFALFPFGQLPALLTTLTFGNSVNIHPTDILVVLYCIVSFTTQQKLRAKLINSYVFKLLCIFFFSSIVGLALFHFFSLISLLYFVRLVSYILFAFLLWEERPISKKEAICFFVITALFISILGLVQYLLLPDTRFLKILGWDDHYFRLLSSFLDPAFTSILLVFSLMFIMFGWKQDHILIKAGVTLIVCSALLLTYSRAGYLALICGVVSFLLIKSKISLKYILAGLVFVCALFLLPRPAGGEGVKLERTFSLALKVQNSIETLQIWKMSPIYGVGYNNICVARDTYPQKTASPTNFSHSCNGADNSFLFLLATVGLVGTLSTLWGIGQVLKKIKNPLVIASLVALLVHTQFTNTLFYPWVFVWIVVLITTASTTENR